MLYSTPKHTLVNKYLPQERKFKVEEVNQNYKETLLSFFFFLFLYSFFMELCETGVWIVSSSSLKWIYFTFHRATTSGEISNTAWLSFLRIPWNSGIISTRSLSDQFVNLVGDDGSNHVAVQVRKSVSYPTVDCLWWKKGILAMQGACYRSP